MNSKPYFVVFFLGCLVALALHIYFFSPISPQILDVPSPSLLNSILPPNTHLQEVIRIGEGVVKNPEDVCVDKDGTLYTAGRDGWIKRLLHKDNNNNLLDNWKWVNSTTLLGMTTIAAAGLVICDTQQGLLKIDENGVTTLVSHFNGSKLRSRCLKYWLQGDLQGKTEIFIDNLPGGPDNINLAPDGSFWIALLQLTRDGFEFVHTSKIAKHLLATFPRLSNIVLGVQKKATVIKVSEDGKILKRFDDPNGKIMSFVTSAVEYEGNLFLGSLNSNFVGKLPLNNYSD